MALTQQLPPLFAQKVNDAGPITDVEARADYLLNGYLGQSAKFSYYEAAYQVGDYSEAQSDPTTVVKFGSGHGKYDDRGINDIKHFYEGYFTRIESEGSIFLYGYVNDLDSASPRCRITTPTGLYDLTVDRKDPQIGVDSGSDEPLLKEVACARPTIDANYSVNKQSLDLKTQNSHLHNMAIATSRALGGMWNKSENIDGGADSGQVSATSACFTDGNAGNAKSEAKDDAEDAAYSAIQTEVNNIEKKGENEMRSVNSGNVGIPLLNAVMDLIYKGFDQTPDKGVELHDNDTSVTEASSQKVDCDSQNYYCENWSCESGFDKTPDADGDYQPRCDPTGTIDYECNTGVKIGSQCYNSSTSPNHVVGTPSCQDYNGYSTSRVGGSCVLDSHPSPTCTNWQQKWEATYDYQLQRVEFDTSVKDESRVPTSASPGTRLPIQRRFIYDFS